MKRKAKKKTDLIRVQGELAVKPHSERFFRLVRKPDTVLYIREDAVDGVAVGDRLCRQEAHEPCVLVQVEVPVVVEVVVVEVVVVVLVFKEGKNNTETKNNRDQGGTYSPVLGFRVADDPTTALKSSQPHVTAVMRGLDATISLRLNTASGVSVTIGRKVIDGLACDSLDSSDSTRWMSPLRSTFGSTRPSMTGVLHTSYRSSRQ